MGDFLELLYALVVELVDTEDLKSFDREVMSVRVRPWAQIIQVNDILSY